MAPDPPAAQQETQAPLDEILKRLEALGSRRSHTPASTPSGPTTPPTGQFEEGGRPSDPYEAGPTVPRTLADRHIPRDEALKAVRHLMDVANIPSAELEAKGPLPGLRYLVRIWRRPCDVVDVGQTPFELPARRATRRFGSAEVRNPNGFSETEPSRSVPGAQRRTPRPTSSRRGIAGLDVNTRDGIIAKASEPVTTIRYSELVRRAVVEVHPTAIRAIGLGPQEIDIALATMPRRRPQQPRRRLASPPRGARYDRRPDEPMARDDGTSSWRAPPTHDGQIASPPPSPPARDADDPGAMPVVHHPPRPSRQAEEMECGDDAPPPPPPSGG